MEDLPHVLDVVCPTVLILKVVGMFPRVDDEKRNRSYGHIVLMIIDLLDYETLPERLPDEGAPAGALDGDGRVAQLLPEAREGTEAPTDRVAQFAVGLITSIRAEIRPK